MAWTAYDYSLAGVFLAAPILVWLIATKVSKRPAVRIGMTLFTVLVVLVLLAEGAVGIFD